MGKGNPNPTPRGCGGDRLHPEVAGAFDSSERGLKDRLSSALFKLLFSHYGQRLPDRSHPLVRLPLLSIGRLRGSPSPILHTFCKVSHFAGRTRGPQLRSALSVSTIAFDELRRPTCVAPRKPESGDL